MPGVAGDVTLDGGSKLVTAGRDGKTWVIATEFDQLRGEQKQYVLRFKLPKGYDHVTVEPSARYPSITWTAGGRPGRTTAPGPFAGSGRAPGPAAPRGHRSWPGAGWAVEKPAPIWAKRPLPP